MTGTRIAELRSLATEASTPRGRVLSGLVAVLAVGSLLAGAADMLVIGLIVGLVYGAVAMGLVLIYKGSRVVNFAHGQMALLAAFATWGLLTDPNPERAGQWIETTVPWALAALVGVAAGAVTGVAVEGTVIRRLFNAPRLIVLVATLGLGQVLFLITFLIWLQGEGEVAALRPFPAPLETSFEVGNFRVLGGHILAAIVVPVVGIGLATFLKFSRTGVAVRAVSDNPDAARLLGIPVRRVSAVTWGLGAALAGVAGILIAPIRGGISPEIIGIELFIFALAAAIIGGLTSLPGALVGGLLVGVGETLLDRFVGISGIVQLMLFLAILAVLLLYASRERETGQLAFAPRIGRVPDWIRDHPTVGVPRMVFGFALAVGIAVLPLLVGPRGNFVLSLMLIFAMLGISLNLLMGTAGQISLGHFALLGVGAFIGAKLITDLEMPYGLAVVLAGLVGGAVAFLIGIPALRIRGLYLAVATLAFAVAAEAFFFRLDVVGARGGISFDRPVIGPFDLAAPSGREYSYLCLLALLMMAGIYRSLLKRRAGRALLAVRENEQEAAVLGLSVRGYKLLGFTFSGVLAAWAGVLHGMLNPPVQWASFPPVRSLEVVAMVIIGGLGSVPGAILGAVYIIGIPRMFPEHAIAPLLATGAGLLLVLMVRPGGLWSLATGLRDFYVWALTVEDRAFKGPLSHLVPPDVPERTRLDAMFAGPEATREPAPERAPSDDGAGTASRSRGSGARRGSERSGRRRRAPAGKG